MKYNLTNFKLYSAFFGMISGVFITSVLQSIENNRADSAVIGTLWLVASTILCFLFAGIEEE